MTPLAVAIHKGSEAKSVSTESVNIAVSLWTVSSSDNDCGL
jgi:hypothetical protein